MGLHAVGGRMGDKSSLVGAVIDEAGLAEVRLLGPIEARTRDGSRIRLGSGRQAAILAVLSLRANTSLDVETLLDAVWDAPYPARATELLHTYLCRLRRAIQPGAPRWRRGGVLSNAGGSYTLALPPNAVDVSVFEELVTQAAAERARGELSVSSGLFESALAMWRGEPLAGLPGPFLERERTRLTERWLAVRQDKLEVDLQLGRHATVVAELRALVAEYPFRERLVELLMLGLCRSGRQGDALSVYAATRARLAEELGVEPGSALQAAYLQILRAENGFDAGPAVPARVPAQLPRDSADFVGRTAELARVEQLLSTGDPGVGVLVVTGRPGVGKSALAVHIGHRVRGRFPDGQVYLDLREAGSGPAAARDTLRLLLAAIGAPPAPDPETVDEATNRYRTAVAGRKLLVVLDNAVSEQQVRPLLPGAAGCAVLISGQTPLAGLDGARHVHLESLNGADSHRLLGNLVGTGRVEAEPEAARAILAACAGLPLAIQLAAGRLTERPDWPLRHLARLLRDDALRLDVLAVADRSVRNRLADAVARLDPPLRHALRSLGHADVAVFDTGVAAAVLGVDRGRAAELVDSLVFHHLLDVVEWGPHDDVRVRFHPLVRLYAREPTAVASRAA
jgi:DNA-binding SARP family transcriptional activator